MKKTTILLGLFFGLCVFQTNAQEQGTISLFANANYNFEETVPYDYADLNIKDGLQWGGGLEYYLNNYSSVELKYNRMDTDFAVKGFYNGDSRYGASKGSLQYYLLGYTGYFNKGSKAVPFLGASVGLGIADTPDFSAETGFAWDLRAGVKMKTGGPVTVKLQAYLQSMLTTAGTDYYYYWGYVYAYPEYHRILQFGFGAVLNYDFKSR